MKKAKILIPSLSLLCFSAIACVTGSVAWFSAVSSAKVATNTFSVKSLDGSMSVSVYHGVGTKATLEGAETKNIIYKEGSTTEIIGYKGSDKIVVKPDTYKVESADVDNVLTHGSFDPAHEFAYTVKPFATTAEYEAVNTKTIVKTNESDFWANDTKGYYHIFSFDMDFNYDFNGASTGKYNLFFDLENSNCTRTTPKTLDTSKGYRIAMINTSSKDWVVWSPFQKSTWDVKSGEQTTTVNSCYIGKVGTATTISKIDYDPALNGNLIYEGDTAKKITDSTGSAARKDCLGTFDASTSTSKITIRFVVWYEGEDPNIVNDATLNGVAASLNFYLKGYKA